MKTIKPKRLKKVQKLLTKILTYDFEYFCLTVGLIINEMIHIKKWIKKLHKKKVGESYGTFGNINF